MKKKSGKISVILPKAVLKEISLEISKIKKADPKSTISRSEIIRSALHIYMSPTNMREVRDYTSLMKNAKELKKLAEEAIKDGSIRRAKKLYFQSASRELDAMSMVEDPDEKSIRSTLLEVVLLLKEATGYAYLPDVPFKPRVSGIHESD
jgi:hypothetical protein